MALDIPHFGDISGQKLQLKAPIYLLLEIPASCE